MASLPLDDFRNQILKSVNEMANEAKELYLDRSVPILPSPPDPLTFYRDYVSANKPVVIKNAFNHWPALKRWSNKYLRDVLGESKLTVAVTANGYADAVTDGLFVGPEDRKITMSQFLDVMDKPEAFPGVFYIQQQNSNFTEEFEKVILDADTHVSWATEAFGKSPDAVNFWMGDERAVTSMHRDHYENIYCVVRGCKKFILIPPTDLPYVPYEKFKCANFKETSPGKFIIEEKNDYVSWIPIDPLDPDYETYPQFANALYYEITVEEGDMLYLPSLWFHHVRQSHGCIAVNFWYDMEFDIKYNYYKLTENILSNLNESKG